MKNDKRYKERSRFDVIIKNDLFMIIGKKSFDNYKDAEGEYLKQVDIIKANKDKPKRCSTVCDVVLMSEFCIAEINKNEDSN